MRAKLILTLVILGLSCRVCTGEELIQAPGAIQISSTVSDGKHTISEIAEIAKQNNIKIVILTDCDFMKWEYGLWPLRRIIKKTVESNSVAAYGIKRYLKDIEEEQKRNPDLVLIPGVESAPFYYWEGSPFRNLKMRNWHKHMLVIGLDKVKDYKMLPSVANRNGLKLPYKLKDIYRFWPILFLIIGILCLRKRKFRYKDLQGHPLGPYSRLWRIFAIIIVFFALLFLFNNFPFAEFKYDQYRGEQGAGPYQNLIDYVNSKGGLTFWAHPEAKYIQRRGKVEIETREYSQDLLETEDYTGFTIFCEGYRKVGIPGGLWDDMLKQYCEGKRNSPVWTIAGLVFDQPGDLGIIMQNLRTIFLIPHLTKDEALKALREGKMYVVKGRAGLVLDKFIVRDSLSDINGTMGDEIDLSGNPVVKISGHFADGRSELVKINLIRGGVIIKTFEIESPFEIDYQDDYSDKDRTIYYRLEIYCSGNLLITNPIFVKIKL